MHTGRFRSIWSQENRLFECQTLRKFPFFEFSEIQSKSSKNSWWAFIPPDSDLSVQNGLGRYLGLSSFQALQRRWEDTSRHLQHRFWTLRSLSVTLRSLSGEQRLTTCFSKIVTVSQKIREHWVFSQPLSFEKSIFLGSDRSENVQCASKTFPDFIMKMRRYF